MVQTQNQKIGKREQVTEIKGVTNTQIEDNTESENKVNGKRIAKNTPIQGTCADLIKIAMINLRDRFKKEQLDAQIVLQVHDELLVEASESCAQAAALILKQEMENVTKLKVPLEVEVRVGKTWFDCQAKFNFFGNVIFLTKKATFLDL